MTYPGYPHHVRIGGYPVHVVRRDGVGETYPNGVPAPSTMLCGAQVSVPRQYGPDASDAGTVLRGEWCLKCLAAYRSEGHGAAEPGSQRSYTR